MTEQTIQRIRKFTEDRDWDQFHCPANLAKSISIEANELLECFQWSDEDYDLEHVKEELADVLVYCRNMLDKLGLDEDDIVNAKMAKNEAKSLNPFEKEVESDGGAVSFLLNVIWFFVSGIELALGNLAIAILLCIPIVGIPFGKQFFKIAVLSLAPFGKRVVKW